MDYEQLMNSRVRELKPSGIRKFFDIAAEMDDVISLGVGEPDFKTPWHIRDAGIHSLEKSQTRYTANRGLKELREEISRYLDRRFQLSYRPDNEILVTVGGSEGIDAALRVLLSEGDEVLYVAPSFVCYEPLVSLCGAKAIPLVTRAENKFALQAEDLKAAITDKTRLLILPFPNNPTGGIMRRKELEAIAEVLRGTDIFVLSDEIYAELTYGEPHISIAAIEGMKERTVLINGFSKCYSMTGWRLGYACGPAPILAQMTKIHQYGIMSAPTTSQYAAIEALRHGDEDIRKMRAEYDMRRRLIVNGFCNMGLSCFEPEGAFYAFPSIQSTGLSSEEFCEKLLYSKKVAVVPGSAFGECGEGFIRASYCESIDHIRTALSRIEEFINENH